MSKAKPAASGEQENRGLLTVPEACSALRVSESKLYRLRKQNRVEFVKLDGSTRVTDRSVQKLLSQMFAAATKKGEDGHANGTD